MSKRLDKTLLLKRIQLLKENADRAKKFATIVKNNAEWCLLNVNRIEDFAEKIKKQIEEYEEDDEEPSRLKIYNNFICYHGLKPINLIGVYRWESLWRELKIYHSWGDKSLEWYENEIFRYPINCIRTGGVKDTMALYEHCRRMRDSGPMPVMVEVTVFRSLDEGVLVTLKDMPDLAKLGNVFFDINEFMITELDEGKETVKKVIDIVETLTDSGCIVVAGSWGYSYYGKDFADEFHRQCNRHQVEQVHRMYDEASIVKAQGYGKPVFRDEYDARHNGLTLAQTKEIMKKTTDLKAHCLYYGFDPEGLPGLTKHDPFDYREMPKYAGELCQKLNS